MEEQEDDHSRRLRSRASGSRRTRSQLAPEWTAHESRTLVNEITAVEGEFGGTVSTFQKWKIVADNCNALLGVNRTSNQCRRKWNSLLSDYKKIKSWESSSSGVGSYWSLDSERRRELGFPDEEELDFGVFRAIDDHLMEYDRTDSEPDNDPDAVADGVDDDVELEPDSGFKKQRSVMHRKHSIGERLKPQKSSTGEKEVPEQISAEEKPKRNKRRREEKMMPENNSIADKEQMMFAKLRDNAELLTAILNGNLDESADFVLADLKNVEASQTAFTRRQGDKVITCLGNLADTLDQICDLVQGGG